MAYRPDIDRGEPDFAHACLVCSTPEELAEWRRVITGRNVKSTYESSED